MKRRTRQWTSSTTCNTLAANPLYLLLQVLWNMHFESLMRAQAQSS